MRRTRSRIGPSLADRVAGLANSAEADGPGAARPVRFIRQWTMVFAVAPFAALNTALVSALNCGPCMARTPE